MGSLKSKLNFNNLDTMSDFDKDIDGEVEEIEIEKESELYFDSLFIPVLTSHDSSLGIFPDDQKISRKGVFLWNSIKTIPMLFKSKDYKILKVDIASGNFRENLKPLGSGVYSLSYIPNTVPLTKSDNQSFYSE